MNYEEIVMGIIVNAGEAKGHSMKAITAGRAKDFDEAHKELDLANEAVSKAHAQQTQMIINEANGNKTEITFLMVHAQDHLMNALSIKDIANEIVGILEDKE